MAPIVSLSLFVLSLTASSLATPLSTAPLYTAEHEAPYGLISDSYIVMLKKDMPPAVLDNHYNFLEAAIAEDPHFDGNGGIRHVFDSHIKGYSGKFTDGVLQKIREMPEVDYVERDQIVRTQDVQNSSTWGLARISHRPKLASGSSKVYKYEYDHAAGEGVDVYVIDTGIYIGHIEFEGRASWGKTIPLDDEDEDANGHGTHCAGTIASRKYGVAKYANVIAVKVLGSDGSGTNSDVIAGVVYAAESAAEKAALAAAEVKATGKTKHKGSVANMSLGGGKSRALNQAVDGAIDTGLHFAVAAGNEHSDACNSSPASAEKTVTVGASTDNDEWAFFSNHGPCVDVFAPGHYILSTWIGSNSATNNISGTSMASPHTAGLLAYLLSIYPSATFDPTTQTLVPAGPNTQHPLTGSFTSLYESVYSVMPRWASSFLPPPRLIEAVTGPIDAQPLSPADLKAALIGLSSKGLLTKVPRKTVNLLIFNNFTTSS